MFDGLRRICKSEEHFLGALENWRHLLMVVWKKKKLEFGLKSNYLQIVSMNSYLDTYFSLAWTTTTTNSTTPSPPPRSPSSFSFTKSHSIPLLRYLHQGTLCFALFWQPCHAVSVSRWVSPCNFPTLSPHEWDHPCPPTQYNLLQTNNTQTRICYTWLR